MSKRHNDASRESSGSRVDRSRSSTHDVDPALTSSVSRPVDLEAWERLARTDWKFLNELADGPGEIEINDRVKLREISERILGLIGEVRRLAVLEQNDEGETEKSLGSLASQLESRASRDATGRCAQCGARVCVRCGRGDRSLILNGTVAGWACHPECPPRSSVAGAPEEATALTHSRSCGYHDSETGCTCCLDERIAADNWREQYAAWFKRANEAETEVATLRARVSQLAEISGRIESVVDTDFAHDEPARAVGVVVDMLGVSEAARLSAEQETERLRITERRLRHAGGLLANVAYNLAQRSTLTENERRALDESRQAWDAEAAATRRPERPAVDPDPSRSIPQDVAVQALTPPPSGSVAP